MAVSAVYFFLALLCTLLPAECEIYKFDKEAVPEPYTLQAKYLFYTHITEDAPRGAMQAMVSFEDLRLHAKPGVNLADYPSVQIGIVPWKDFSSVVLREQFCAPTGTLALQNVDAKKHVRLHTVKAPQLDDASFDLQASGAYALVVTNCGSQGDIRMSGSISVRNPYGYLPGNEYFKLPMYGWSVLIWAAACVAWAVTLLMNGDKLAYVHYALMFIVCTALAESAVWWLHLRQTNNQGVTSDMQSCTKYKIMAVTSLYSLAAMFKVCIFSNRHRHALNDNIIFGAAVPVALMAAVQFGWILRAVSSQLRRFHEIQEAEAVKLYQRTAMLCVLGFMVALLALGMQLSDKPGKGTESWHYHVLSTDGISQVGSLVVISAMMFLWTPRAAGFVTMPTVQQEEEKETEGLTEGGRHPQEGTGKSRQAELDGELFVVGGDPFDDDDEEGGEPRQGLRQVDTIGDEEDGGPKTGQPQADTIGAPAFAGAE